MASSTTKPVATISAISDRLFRLKPARYMKPKVVTIENMNHVLREVKGTHKLVQLPSYFDPSLPLHPKLVPELTAFLKQSLGGK